MEIKSEFKSIQYLVIDGGLSIGFTSYAKDHNRVTLLLNDRISAIITGKRANAFNDLLNETLEPIRGF